MYGEKVFDVNLRLTRAEFDLLLLALGMAAGAATKIEQGQPLANSILRLANAVNRDNPNWKNYEGMPGE